MAAGGEVVPREVEVVRLELEIVALEVPAQRAAELPRAVEGVDGAVVGDHLTPARGDLEVARIVVVCDGPDARVRLTEAYAPVFVCMEHFGKVRTFLRRHGWKPADERAAE